MRDSRKPEWPKFDWDDANVSHLARHRVSPCEAMQAIVDPDALMVEIQDEGEERVKAVGRTAAGRLVVVVFTERRGLLRAVTAYDAPVRLQELYLEGEPI